MFRAVTVRILAIAVCGGLLAGSAGALTLGPARSAALIGRPFEAAVPVTLDAPQADPPCASADLFYGESRSPGTPSVQWEAKSPTQGVVRIRSTTPVDEPMVTLYVRVGCQQQTTTRRYVLLSEPPPVDEPAARAPLVPPLARAAPVPSLAPVARANASASARKAPAAQSAPSAARSSAPSPGLAERAAPVARATSARATAPSARAGRPVTARAQPRLQLDSPDLAVERDPALRLSPQLSLQPADPQERQALLALWQAVQAGPERMMQDTQRLQALQRELDSLRTVTRQNAGEIAQLRAQAGQESRDRSTATLLAAALAAVLLALLAWLGWRWHRLQQVERVGRWFEANGEPLDGRHSPEPVPSAAAVVAASSDAPAPASSVPARRALAPVPARSPVFSEEFQGSRGGPVRIVGVEELIDVHDKADFFLSIGETEQALALLDAHVHDEVETGALAWMDLLELYHSLGRRDEYDRLRAEFRQRFMAQVPEFEHFDQPAPSLEGYSRALSRIVALWPSPQVRDVIGQSIFRQAGAPGMEPFSLEAYRELVLLYHIAREMIPEQGGGQKTAPVASFPDTSVQLLHGAQAMHVSLPAALDSSRDEPPLSEEELLMLPPASARVGVDIDLDDAQAEPDDVQALDFDISTFEPAHEPER